MTVNAERSRFFGPDETWFFSGNGSTYRNLDADFYFQWVKQRGMVEALIAKKPPDGPTRDVRKGVRGYVRGYNQYLRDRGVDRIPDRRCRGEEWVRPIKPIDVYRRFFQLGILASSGAVIDGIVGASPVSPAAAQAGDALPRPDVRDRRGARSVSSRRSAPTHTASAARQPTTAAASCSATRTSRGTAPSACTRPTCGSRARSTSPAASLYGVPLILIGHTRGLAWSHTVATAWRFTPFKLTLALR